MIFNSLQYIAEISRKQTTLILPLDQYHDYSPTKNFIFGQPEAETTRMWANANVMAALPNIDGALCLTPQSLADAHY